MDLIYAASRDTPDEGAPEAHLPDPHSGQPICGAWTTAEDDVCPTTVDHRRTDRLTCGACTDRAAPVADILEVADAVAEGDAVTYATSSHEYQAPLDVVHAETVTWVCQDAPDWRTAELVLRTDHGTRITILVNESEDSVAYATHVGMDSTQRYRVVALDHAADRTEATDADSASTQADPDADTDAEDGGREASVTATDGGTRSPADRTEHFGRLADIEDGSPFNAAAEGPGGGA